MNSCEKSIPTFKSYSQVSGSKLIKKNLILLLNKISKKSAIKIFQFAQKRYCPKLPAKSETQKF